MTFLIQQTLIYAVPLMIVALAGVFAERSGIINLALEGIMIFGAFIGVLFVRLMQGSRRAGRSTDRELGGYAGAGASGYAGGGSHGRRVLPVAELRLHQPAGRPDHRRYGPEPDGSGSGAVSGAYHCQPEHPAAGYRRLRYVVHDQEVHLRHRQKNTDLGFFGETFLVKVYLATYVCIILFVILAIILYKTRFGLRLRACGENPQAADSLGINVKKMRYAGTTISGALAGMGGFVYALTTANCSSNGDVAGFGFLALAVMIFGNWRPLNIAGASLLFGLFKCIAAAYSSIDINGDGVYWLAEIGISSHLYRMLPYIITLLVLAFTSKKSRAPPRRRVSPTTRLADKSGSCLYFQAA